MNDEIFKARLKEIIQNSGKKYSEVSLDIYRNHSYISSVLRGVQKMQSSDFFRFCEYMGITEAQFFTLENKQPARELELLKEARKLPERVFLTYLEQINAYNEAAERK